MKDGWSKCRLTKDECARMRGERDLLTVLCVQTEIDGDGDKKEGQREKETESEKVERLRVRQGKKRY